MNNAKNITTARADGRPTNQQFIRQTKGGESGICVCGSNSSPTGLDLRNKQEKELAKITSPSR